MKRKSNNFRAKYRNRMNLKEKQNGINNMEKDLQELKDGPKAKILLDSLRATIKKIPNSKTSCHDAIHGFWF